MPVMTESATMSMGMFWLDFADLTPTMSPLPAAPIRPDFSGITWTSTTWKVKWSPRSIAMAASNSATAWSRSACLARWKRSTSRVIRPPGMRVNWAIPPLSTQCSAVSDAKTRASSRLNSNCRISKSGCCRLDLAAAFALAVTDVMRAFAVSYLGVSAMGHRRPEATIWSDSSGLQEKLHESGPVAKAMLRRYSVELRFDRLHSAAISPERISNHPRHVFEVAKVSDKIRHGPLWRGDEHPVGDHDVVRGEVTPVDSDRPSALTPARHGEFVFRFEKVAEVVNDGGGGVRNDAQRRVAKPVGDEQFRRKG